ncbi:MAG: hypothetical protein NT159_01130 [Proteobacteria bacterium]|nr:hypothetical protein [Pseudomonadota bacterium]
MDFTSIKLGLENPSAVPAGAQLSPHTSHGMDVVGHLKCEGGKFCRSKPATGKDYRHGTPAESPPAVRFTPSNITLPKNQNLSPVLSDNLISDFQIQADMF